MESDSDGSETVWDGRTWGGLERANWSIKGIQGPWKEEKREEEREGRRETGRAPPTSWVYASETLILTQANPEETGLEKQKARATGPQLACGQPGPSFSHLPPAAWDGSLCWTPCDCKTKPPVLGEHTCLCSVPSKGPGLLAACAVAPQVHPEGSCRPCCQSCAHICSDNGQRSALSCCSGLLERPWAGHFPLGLSFSSMKWTTFNTRTAVLGRSILLTS